MKYVAVFAGVLLGAVVGCGGPRVAPVSGRVTLGGKALVNATVIFEPQSSRNAPGPGSHGKTNSNGEYTLKLMTGDQDGALIGTHKVSITAYEGDDSVVPSSAGVNVFRHRLVPEEYNARSQLTFEVTARGSTDANFDIPAPKTK